MWLKQVGGKERIAKMRFYTKQNKKFAVEYDRVTKAGESSNNQVTPDFHQTSGRLRGQHLYAGEGSLI